MDRESVTSVRSTVLGPIAYVCLNVHKDTIAVALAGAGRHGEVRDYGQMPNTPTALKTLAVSCRGELRRLSNNLYFG
jgi:hypothetical protein